MASETTARGNLLTNPIHKIVKVNGQDRKIAELRIMSDVWRDGPEGDRIQDADKTHPMQVTVWNERLAEACANTLRSGMRVRVTGQTYPHIYRISDQDRAQGKTDLMEIRMDAEDVTLCLNRVESVTMAARTAPAGA